MRTYSETLLCLIICTLLLSASLSAQTTAFTYQGNLNLSGSPANGNYDFEFVLFDALNGGSQVGTTQTLLGVAVTNGTFSALLDFGAQFPGADRFIEIRVRPAGGGGFQQLLPRQKIASQPYAVKALSSETASSATTAATATNALSLGGVAANQYVLTTDPRMADARTPTAGSSSYIQNGLSQQASSNFNISGTGTANILNALTQLNIGGSRAFSTPNSENVFGGILAGNSNAGIRNSFFGWSAGSSNTNGGNNTFLGWNAGSTNTSGSNNSLLGSGTSLGSNNLSYATAIGAGSTVGSSFTVVLGRTSDSVEIPGNLEVGGAGPYGLAEYYSSFSRVTGYEGNLPRIIGRRVSGSKSAPLPVTSGLSLFEISGGGWNGTSFSSFGSTIKWVASEDWTPTAHGSQIEFNLAIPGTTNSFIKTMTLTSAGIGIMNAIPTETLDIADNGSHIIFGGAGCPSGSVAIGLNGPFSNCTNYTVRGNGTDLLLNRPAGGEVVFRENNGNTQLRIRPGGVIQIPFLGTAGSTALCRNASSDIAGCSSSLRYKENISPFTSGLDLLLRLRPISFNWKDGGMLDLGLAAEDVAAIEPLLTTQNANGEIEGVKYDRVGVVLINAVKEQQEQIVKLERTVNEQREYMEQMRLIICELKPGSAACRKQ